MLDLNTTIKIKSNKYVLVAALLASYWDERRRREEKRRGGEELQLLWGAAYSTSVEPVYSLCSKPVSLCGVSVTVPALW